MFGEWYARTFSSLPVFIQVLLWFMYGFAWIPLLYLIHWGRSGSSAAASSVSVQGTSRLHGISPSRADVKRRVAFPGFALLGVGLLGVLFNTLFAVVELSMPARDHASARTDLVMGTTMLICAGASGLVVLAGFSMIQLRRYSLAMAGGVLATIGMCLVSALGFPVGIWAIVVLLNQDVRGAFSSEDAESEGVRHDYTPRGAM